MLARKPRKITRQQAKSHLKKHGWTYRNVSKPHGPLPVTYVHLCLVLNGVRESNRLIKAVLELPSRNDFEASKTAVAEK